MILKKFKRTSFQKTKAAMIGGLVDYVLAHKDEEGARKRLYCFGMNFLTRDHRGVETGNDCVVRGIRQKPDAGRPLGHVVAGK